MSRPHDKELNTMSNTHSSRGLCAAALLLAGLCSLPALAAPATGTATEVMAIPAAEVAALQAGFSDSRQINTQRGGDKIYQAICQGCHMPQGQGSKGAGFYPALAGNTKLAAGAYPVGVVMNGLHGMPSFAARLNDEQVAEVVNYVRTHFGNQFTDAVKADDVKLFRK
ncbi:c-type cytochrome [Comamonas terrigena]|uniref:c-type cytochrome n=2 Tax=Comamonas terrigena TaxID=32013 RepID=UPI00244A891F|nr:cytochrome c [Comamonas terrigena]MDH0051193.1 cytochrome c [Comamonas terrigena]MDH1093154.1 cytochrome c [Comamonas terrigena]